MEVDINKLAQMQYDLSSAATGVKTLYSEVVVNVVAPVDDEYEPLEVRRVIKNLSVELVSSIRNLYDKISAVMEDAKNAEKENSGIADKLGDKVDLDAGLKYYETGLGEGNSGTIGSEVRPEDAEYVVDRIAIYANGMLIDNIGETGTDIDKCIMDYEKKYGKIEISYHVSMVGEDGSHNATGWLDREQVAERSLVGDETIDLEEAFKEIDEKYENYTETMLVDVKKDESNLSTTDVMAGVISELSEEQNKVAEPVVEPVAEPVTKYDNVYIHETGQTYNKYYATIDLEGKQANELKSDDHITVICGDRTSRVRVNCVNAEDNGKFEIVFDINSRCEVTVPEIAEEYARIHDGATEFKVDGEKHYIKLEKDRESYTAGDKIVVDGKECTIESNDIERDRVWINGTICYVDGNGNKGKFDWETIDSSKVSNDIDDYPTGG